MRFAFDAIASAFAPMEANKHLDNFVTL